MLRRIAVGVALVAGLSSCDRGPEVDVEGIERRFELIEQQQRAAAESKEELEKTIEALETSEKEKAEKHTAEIAELRARIDETHAMIEDVELKLEEPPKPPVRPGRPDPALRYKVSVGDSHARGPADARVTVVIFSDFQCPFCKRVQATLREVERDYKGDVRLVAKHNPLPMHRNAMEAAMAAEAAGKQGKFWEMHDLLYENNRDLTRANFIKWAKKIGCTASEFERDLDDKGIEDRIEDDKALSSKVGARGTPAFFINGRFLSGAQPLSSFKRLIDEEMKEADKRLATGTTKSNLYRELMRSAKTGV